MLSNIIKKRDTRSRWMMVCLTSEHHKVILYPQSKMKIWLNHWIYYNILIYVLCMGLSKMSGR